MYQRLGLGLGLGLVVFHTKTSISPLVSPTFKENRTRPSFEVVSVLESTPGIAAVTETPLATCPSGYLALACNSQRMKFQNRTLQ